VEAVKNVLNDLTGVYEIGSVVKGDGVEIL
jgi:hypothetical protein